MRAIMDKLSATCLEKVETFRIKELKDVLTRIGAAKQGKRQVLIDKVMAIVWAPERQPFGSKGPDNSSKYGLSREEVAKIIDDVYRKMRGSSALDLATTGDVLVSTRTSTQSNKRGETITRCPCGSKVISESLIQCEDRKCMVWQHVNCVIIPEKEGSDLEHPSQFYCELCRIQHGDPYCVAVCHPLQPIKMVTSIPVSEGSNSLQNVENSFLLSRSEKDMLLKPQYDIQVWSVLLNDKVAFRMHWPLHTELRINGCPIRATNRPGHQALGANGRDDGVVISDYVREGSNSIFVSASDERPFCIGVRIIQRLNVDQVLCRIPSESEGESFDTALARVKRCTGGGGGPVDNGNDSDSDLEVISECVFVSLRCPMSGSRMKLAGRFRQCAHMGCFDLHTFVELNQRTRKWQCPVCITNYSLDDLIIDPFLNRIVKAMKSYGEDVVEVEMKPDGQWRPKLEGDAKIKEPWRLPDGSFVLANGEHRSKSNQLPLKSVKIEEGLPVDKIPLKIGIKRTRDGKWQVKQTKGLPGLLNNGIHDQLSVFASADYSRSSSMTANTNEAFSSREMLPLSRVADPEVSSIPSEVPSNLHQPVGSMTAGSEHIRDDEVIVLSDTEEENIEECNLEEERNSRLAMPQVQNEALLDERDLETNISILEMEPLQESTVDFFDNTRGGSISAADPWLSQTHNTPLQVKDAARSSSIKALIQQRPRSRSAQTNRRPTHALSNEQYRRNGTSETRRVYFERPAQYNGIENPRESASTDPSLRLFLPPQPAKVVVQRSRVNERPTNFEKGLRDGWFSLGLGDGERMEETQPLERGSSFDAEEVSQDFHPFADPASALLNLRNQGTPAGTRGDLGHKSMGIAMHRSAHRSRSYFRVDSDSDSDDC